MKRSFWLYKQKNSTSTIKVEIPLAMRYYDFRNRDKLADMLLLEFGLGLTLPEKLA